MALPVLQRDATKSTGWNVVGLSCAFVSLLLAVVSLLVRQGTSMVNILIPAVVLLIAISSCVLWLYRIILASRSLSITAPQEQSPARGGYPAVQSGMPPVTGSYRALSTPPVTGSYRAVRVNASTVSQPFITQQVSSLSVVGFQPGKGGNSSGPVPLYPTSGTVEQEQQVLMPLSPTTALSMEQILYLEFDQPMYGERCFILPKESEPLIECQDRYALDSAKRCYAVGDGVSDSFLSGPWARLITGGFVTRTEVFGDKESFLRWLDECAQAWHELVYHHWVPAINEQRLARGESLEDWGKEISRGAQATLVGCVIEQTQELGTGLFNVHVLAIGDSLCFLFRQDAGEQWKLVKSHPLRDPAEFGYRPDTLMTVDRSDMRELSWERRKMDTFSAQHGDLIVLATDTLAKWLLTQVQQNTAHWMTLLINADRNEFARIVHEELHAKRIEEDDDMTMLVIPV